MYVTAILAVAAGVLVARYLRSRGARVVTCPANMRPAGVEIDATHAMVHFGSNRLASCTRWPEMQGCAQDCLRQIQQAPDGCLVRNILGSWYRGRHCVACGREFGLISWSEHQPGLLAPSGQIVEWREIPADKVFEVLLSHQPLCWDCDLMKRFTARHSELIVDRHRIHDPFTGGVLVSPSSGRPCAS